MQLVLFQRQGFSVPISRSLWWHCEWSFWNASYSYVICLHINVFWMHMVTRWNFTFDVLRGPDEHGEAVQAVLCASDISGFLLTEEVACNGKSHLSLRYSLKLNVLTEVFFETGNILVPSAIPSALTPQWRYRKNIRTFDLLQLPKRMMSCYS